MKNHYILFKDLNLIFHDINEVNMGKVRTFLNDLIFIMFTIFTLSYIHEEHHNHFSVLCLQKSSQGSAVKSSDFNIFFIQSGSFSCFQTQNGIFSLRPIYSYQKRQGRGVPWCNG